MLKLWVVLAVTLGACGSDEGDDDTGPDAALELDAPAGADASSPDAGPPADAELPANDCRVLCGSVGYHCSPGGEWLCNVAAQDIPCELDGSGTCS